MILQAKSILENACIELGIDSYLKDPSVTEIMVNPDNKIFIKVLGKGIINTKLVADPRKTLHIIQVLSSLEGLVINANNPRISTTLPLTNSRFEGLVPPVVSNPTCTIRKKSIKILSLENYIEQGILTEELKQQIENYVHEKKNILIVGGTDTGKTTFANAIIKVLEKTEERLLFIEEVQELQSNIEDLVRMVVIEGIFEPKAALKSAMRMSPHRIIYGEVRGAEAFDLINAFNSGHPGGVCTIHANDCLLGLKKLEMYIMYEKQQPLSPVISETINVVITLKLEEGYGKSKRYLDSIAEVQGYKEGNYILNYIYRHKASDTCVTLE